MINIKIFLDKEGNWYYAGQLIINEKIIELFYKSLTYKNGNYYLVHNGEEKKIDVEDAPYFAEGVVEKDSWLYLKLKGGLMLPMEGPVYFKNRIPYTSVNNLPVKFTRKAFWALSRYFSDDGQKIICGNFCTKIVEEGEGDEKGTS